jgi:PAS domain S-box-containing protein
MSADSHWHSLIQNLPEIILTLDEQRRIDYINRTDSHLRPEQVIGLHYLDFLHEPDRERVAGGIERVFSGGPPEYFETEARAPDGSILGWYSARIGPLVRYGRIRGVVMISSNITERRHMAEQLRQLTVREQTCLEEERRRIARELHDELGQLLTALNIDIAWVERRCEAPEMCERLQSMKDIVATTMSTVRRMASSLRPPLLDDLGLAAAIDWLLQDTCTRAGLEYRLATSLSSTRVDEALSLGIYRICQEALTNVVRHARATHVEVELKQDGPRVCLRFSDNGKGRLSDRASGSLGLLGMRERVDKLQGTLSIDCSEGSGTCIVAEFPLGA